MMQLVVNQDLEQDRPQPRIWSLRIDFDAAQDVVFRCADGQEIDAVRGVRQVFRDVEASNEVVVIEPIDSGRCQAKFNAAFGAEIVQGKKVEVVLFPDKHSAFSVNLLTPIHL